MALESPDWLNADYVQKILQRAEQDESITVSSVTVKPATAVGDNYSSFMHRATVEFSRVKDGQKIQEEQSFIVKAAVHSDPREEMMDAIGFFKTELSMWSVTLTKMNKILQNLFPTPLSPRCLFVQYEKPRHGVIEDLARQNFRMADRQAGLDLDHCLLALRNLGRFHAASVALKEEDPKSVTMYGSGLLNKDQSITMGRYFDLGLKQLVEVAAKWPELSPRITEKLEKLSDVLYETACQAALYREDDFNVLNHGDFWVNNMLFRYDEERKPIDLIFVDFQFSNYISPVVDILYFLGTSPRDEVRLHHRESLLREYYVSLTNTMKNLKCITKAPSFEELKESLKQRAFCEVFAAVSILPYVVLEKGEEINFEEMMKENKEYANPAYRGQSLKKIMTRLLPFYDSLGLLDV